jgi:hypothetical protein
MPYTTPILPGGGMTGTYNGFDIRVLGNGRVQTKDAQGRTTFLLHPLNAQIWMDANGTPPPDPDPDEPDAPERPSLPDQGGPDQGLPGGEEQPDAGRPDHELPSRHRPRLKRSRKH